MRRRAIRGLVAGLLLAVALPSLALAADGDAPPIDSGDTAWMLVATALVMVMLPGLALFYGGLVRRKNVLSTIMHSFFGLALVSVVWVLDRVLARVRARREHLRHPRAHRRARLRRASSTSASSPARSTATTIPFVLFAAFQLMFAAITPALITGAFAERKRFASFVIFTLLWSILVYSPIAHWVWATDGWLYKLGALDFAGGTVVHASSGVSALIVALLIGRRVVNGDRMEPHDIPMTVLGAGLLWFGWFGFNAGSALAAGRPRGERAPRHEHRGRGRDDHLGPRELPPQAQGQRRRARPAARSPASSRSRRRPGFVTAGGALVIGLVAGGLCYSATLLRERLKVDDALDVFAVHGVGGDVRRDRDRRLRDERDQRARPGPHRRQSRPGRDPARRRRRDDRLRGRRDVRDRQGRRRRPRASASRRSEEEVGLDLAVHGEVAYQS